MKLKKTTVLRVLVGASIAFLLIEVVNLHVNHAQCELTPVSLGRDLRDRGDGVWCILRNTHITPIYYWGWTPEEPTFLWKEMVGQELINHDSGYGCGTGMSEYSLGPLASRRVWVLHRSPTNNAEFSIRYRNSSLLSPFARIAGAGDWDITSTGIININGSSNIFGRRLSYESTER